MKLLLVALVVTGALLLGCGRKAAPPPQPLEKGNGGASVESLLSKPATEQPANPAAGVTPPSGPPPKPVNEEKAAPLPGETAYDPKNLDTINYAVRKFFSQIGRPPRDVSELVARGYISKVPVPPPGKKYIYDPAEQEFKLVAK